MSFSLKGGIQYIHFYLKTIYNFNISYTLRVELQEQQQQCNCGWEGLSLRCSCAVWVMLATLAMTVSSCFNHWRQTDARLQLEPFPAALILAEKRNMNAKPAGVLIWKRPAPLEEYPSSCHIEGPTDFFFFRLFSRSGTLNFFSLIPGCSAESPTYDLRVLH